ncbi:hypothetical protein SAMN06295912_1359 [Sphingomonas laterariae]|uniref:Uncharacterized protein n=1 Tax=Edaphosphingomonas laterariae TaxID=861865 RepID=A0A239JHS4_9SPHN|nr:hypothetical protein [Sphingomonas laterariae]SNT05367.1 hypothetical protein SAMN06295912_1359 [Sphingomonas laterariae]
MLAAAKAVVADPDLEQSIEDFLPVAADMRAMLETSERMRPGTRSHQQALAYVNGHRADIATRAGRHGLSEAEFSAILYAELAARRSGRRVKRVAVVTGTPPELLSALARETEALRAQTAARQAYKAARQVYAEAQYHRRVIEAQVEASRVSL